MQKVGGGERPLLRKLYDHVAMGIEQILLLPRKTIQIALQSEQNSLKTLVLVTFKGNQTFGLR